MQLNYAKMIPTVRSNEGLVIIKSIHVGETDLKNVSCLIRLSDEKQFMISLRSELIGEVLKSPAIRKF